MFTVVSWAVVLIYGDERMRDLTDGQTKLLDTSLSGRYITSNKSRKYSEIHQSAGDKIEGMS